MWRSGDEILLVMSCFLMSFSLINLRYWLCRWIRQRVITVFAAMLVHFNGIVTGAILTYLVFDKAINIEHAWLAVILLALMIPVEWISIETSVHWKVEDERSNRKSC